MTEATSQATAPASPEFNRDRAWWRIATVCAAVLLVLTSVGITAAVVDDGDDDDSVQLVATPGSLIVGDDEALARTATITPERASTIAVEASGGGIVTDLDLDSEGGRVIYEVEVHDPDASPAIERHVTIDAETGEVIVVLDDD
ncbi:MAG: PepSY domain-containing protein [Acidimicrobiia bacterium]